MSLGGDRAQGMTTTDMGRVLARAGEMRGGAVTHGPLLRYAAFQSVGEYI